MTYAQKAEKLKPGAGVILDTIGWINFKMKQIDQARDDIAKALEQHPDNPMINYHMGMILHSIGKKEAARIYLEKAVENQNDFLGADTAGKLLASYKAPK